MSETEALHQARSLYRQRRARDALFAPELFGEPAWDLLLTLYIARCEGHCLSMPALSLSVNLPLADASEWVRTLEASRLIQKDSPTKVNEPARVCISDAGFHTITTVLLQQPVRMSS